MQTLQTLTGSALVGYTTVFAIEVVMILVALGLSFKLRIEESEASREERQVLEAAS